MNTKCQIVTDDYRDPVVFALALQIPIAILCALLLDGGQMARICAATMAGHWVGVLLVMHQRPHAPTSIDRIYIRTGFLMLFIPLVIFQDFLR